MRVLVETHSEHLVMRIRRLIAEGKVNAGDVALYFVERDMYLSTVREVPIDRNGHIDQEDWPKGFFGESLSESLALAAAQGK
jgi:predicted ATPase